MLHSNSYLTSASNWSATAYDVCFPLHITLAFLSPALVLIRGSSAQDSDTYSYSQDRSQVGSQAAIQSSSSPGLDEAAATNQILRGTNPILRGSC